MKIIILCIILLFAGCAYSQIDFFRDVCVIGGGASGASAAVFLQDNGYDVLLIEKKNRLGGNCHSYTINPAPPGGRGWIDSGVSAILNTTFLQNNGISEVIKSIFKDKYVEYKGAENIKETDDPMHDIVFLKSVGVTEKNIIALKDLMVKSESKNLGKSTKNTYAVDSAAFARRFTTQPLLDFSVPSYPTWAADYNTKSIYNGPFPSVNVTNDFLNAFVEYSILLYNYPWLNQGDYPDPIPAELAQPFSSFITQYNLTALHDLFRLYLVNYRSGSFSQYSALSAISDLGQWVLSLQSNPQAGFVVTNGCSQIYNGIYSYLGNQNVWLNMNIQTIVRTGLGALIVAQSTEDYFEHIVSCGKLVVAVPALLDNLNAFSLSTNERNLFKDISAFNIYPFIVNAGIQSSYNPYSCIMNINNTDQFLFPASPMVSQICRFGSTSGPSQSWLITPSSVGITTAYSLISSQLSGLNTIFTYAGESAILDIKFHYYGPHFSVSALQQSPNPYTKLAQLQGQQNTYWIGASFVPDWTHINWNRAKKVVNQYFPPQKKSQTKN